MSSSLTFVEVEAYAKKESGCANTSKAIATIAYANIAKQEKVNLLLSGLIINPVSPWLGCIADRKAYDIGAEEGGPMPLHLLEVKVMKEGLLTSATLNISPPILVMVNLVLRFLKEMLSKEIISQWYTESLRNVTKKVTPLQA